MGRTVELDGEQFGDFIVIGDTGKRDSSNRQIILARNVKTGEIVESPQSYFKRGQRTGFIGSEANKENATKQGKKYGPENGKKNMKKIHEKYVKEGTRLDLLTDIPNSNNTSGVRGVTYLKNSNKWRAQLQIKGERVLNKVFQNKEDAIAARKAAEEKYFKPILEKYNQK